LFGPKTGAAPKLAAKARFLCAFADPRQPRDSAQARMVQIFSFHLVLVLLYLLLAWIAILWIWGRFLDMHEHNPDRVRAAMFAILAVATSLEFSLAAFGVMHWWVAVVSLIANLWGGVDALLRYPVSHQIDSFFVLKQFVLLVVKTLAFAVGMVTFRNSPAVMLAVLPGFVWGLPLLYLMALPMDPAEQVSRDDATNVDIALRVWKFAVNPLERHSCITSCRGWWYRSLSAASECSMLARLVVCTASSEHRRALRKRGRSV